MKNARAEIVYTPRCLQVVQYRGAGPKNRAGDRLDRSPLRCTIYAPRVKVILLPHVADGTGERMSSQHHFVPLTMATRNAVYALAGPCILLDPLHDTEDRTSSHGAYASLYPLGTRISMDANVFVSQAITLQFYGYDYDERVMWETYIRLRLWQIRFGGSFSRGWHRGSKTSQLGAVRPMAY